jgi:hypothetical protein
MKTILMQTATWQWCMGIFGARCVVFLRSARSSMIHGLFLFFSEGLCGSVFLKAPSLSATE